MRDGIVKVRIINLDDELEARLGVIMSKNERYFKRSILTEERRQTYLQVEFIDFDASEELNTVAGAMLDDLAEAGFIPDCG